MSGVFITFEGGEGCGKTTQIQRLKGWIKSQNPTLDPLVTREPGGTISAEAIRDLLVKGTADKWLPATEAMLMSASRHEHVEHVLRPELSRGRIVISDRYNDSTRVYQGLVGGVAKAEIEALNAIACGDLVPDLTILLDLDVDVGLARAGSRESDETRFESKGSEFHYNIRQAFLELAAQYTDRFVVIDASQSPEQVAADIQAAVLPHLSASVLANG